MKLRISEAVELANSIAQLSGYNKIVTDGGKNRPVQVPYDFTGATRFSLAKNFRTLRTEVQAYEAARNEVVRANDDRGRMEEEISALLRTEIEVDLVILREADFKTELNPIPPTVLSDLMLIME
ncbi:MAG: hypothetical protein ACTHLA_01540 [Asticcacaulis sp.]|uniref:hypothetical protein n=1 Tax=Asticcacaulis sp. TaxID=1872648 RepID=UPI003F7CC2E0